jgi:RNase P subunit RPR2
MHRVWTNLKTSLEVERNKVSKQYLHLSAYACNKCEGPVVTGSVGTRATDISKEVDIQEVGAVCLTCGQKQNMTDGQLFVRQFPPVEWPIEGSKAVHVKSVN